MPGFLDDLLDEPAPTGARRVALHFVAEAAAAFPRLEREDDPEALHDFRVALRRLRSTLRSYDEQFGESVPRKLRKQLRTLARATGASRDAEVHAAWLARELPSLTDAERIGVEFFAARLDRAREAADAELADRVHDRFPRLRRRLARRLRRYTAVIDVERRDAAPSYAAATATLLDALAAELQERLAAVAGIDDQDAAHEARIAGKRLRYAVEPLAGLVAGAEGVVKQIKRLQDAFGELHDAHVFALEVEALLASDDAAVAVPDPRPGLAGLAGRLRRRRDDAFAAAGVWLGDGAHGLLADVWRVASRLAERADANVEVERKYLLSAVPNEARGAPSKEIDQGYLPGERLVERVRRVRADGDERYYRTVKVGTGLRRTELEESTTRAVFDALWPLTEGRRVRKRRYAVPAGALTWEIDEFADRSLVLAEVELPGVEDDVALPPWLQPLVVGEVTDDPTYLNARLAR